MKGRGPPRWQASLPSSVCVRAGPTPSVGGRPPSSVRRVCVSQAPALLRLSSLPSPAWGYCEAPRHIVKSTAGDSVRGDSFPIDLARLAGDAPIRCGGVSCSSECGRPSGQWGWDSSYVPGPPLSLGADPRGKRGRPTPEGY